jgi:hypothetical protein
MPKHARKSRSYYIIRSIVRWVLGTAAVLAGLISMMLILGAIAQIGR